MVLLAQLKDAVLHFHLPFHHIEVCLLLLVTLKLKEQGVVNEVLNWLLEIQKVEVGVYESETEVFGLKEGVNLGLFLAHHHASPVGTF